MYKVNKYPDGTSYVNSTDTSPAVIRINSYEELWQLNQYVDAFISAHGIQPNVTIPNLIDAQADRRFDKGATSGLKLVLKFLKSLPVKHYYIFHPHNQEVVEAYLDNVTIIDNINFITQVFSKIVLEIPTFENLILMSSDAGGFKPLMKLCDKLGWKGVTESASKSRKYEDGVSKLIQKVDKLTFEGKDILIIDDISVYGGTFKGLSKLLRERNCGKLYLAVSHMTIQNLGDDPVTNYFDYIFTTNSKFDNYFIADKKGEPKTPDNLVVIKQFNI